MAYIETPNLPANAAQEAGGNLAAIASVQGVGGTGISPPSGGSGILGFLSGIYNRLASTLTVSISGTPSVTISNNPVLGAGNNNIGIVTPSYLLPVPWNGLARDMRQYSSVLITCTVAPNSPYQINVSPDDNSDYIPQSVIINNASGITTTTTIGSIGTFSLSGHQYIKLSAGSGGTFFIAGGQ